MFRVNPNQARKALKQFVRKWGTPVTLQWLELPAGALDPTTGACAPGSASPRQCNTKALVHFVSPAMSVSRLFAEVESGDCILELAAALFRVESAGNTDLAVGAIVDEYALLRVNNALGPGGTPATASEILPHILKHLEVEIAGERWVQQKVGEELARTWDAVFAGVKFSQSFLLRKAT